MKTKTRKSLNTMLTLPVSVILAAALILSGCAGDKTNTASTQGNQSNTGNTSSSANAKVEQQTYPLSFFRGYEEEDREDSEMNLYFVNGGSVPYVAFSEYMPFYGSLYENKDAGFKAIEYDISNESGIYTAERKDDGWLMAAVPDYDSIYFNSYDAFVRASNNTSLVGLVTIGENGLGSNKLIRDSGMSYDRQGYVNEFDLSRFNIDIIESDGECYVPLQTMQDVLLAQSYYLTVFNGERIFMFPYGLDTIDDEIYAGEPAEMSEDLAEFNARELMFFIDYFYGLKPEHGIDDTWRFFANTELDFTTTDPNKFDSALTKLTSLYFDDSHSGFNHASCHVDPNYQVSFEDFANSIGASQMSGFIDIISYGNARKKYNPEFKHPMDSESDLPDVFDYTEIGDTAIITFDAFMVNKTDYYKEADLENPQDTIELVIAAHKQITREGSPIKNVVVDLSCNGGGNADAAVFIIAWLTGNGRIAMRNTFTGAQSVLSYEADVNLDGEFDEKDSLASKTMSGDINIYCMTSENSFSCGNLVPAALKDVFGVTIIGQTSGGGSCVVLPSTTASGAQFQISSPFQISTMKNGSFYNSDTGIDVDVPIRKLETMYDRQKLVEFIHDID